MKNIFVLAIAVCAFSGCGTERSSTAQSNANTSANSNQSVLNVAKVENVSATPASANVAIKTGSGVCPEEKQAGKRFIQKQTFAINFKPFEGACFVTFGSEDDMLDEKDLPRGSTFYMYQDRKQVFAFPDAFSGQSGCWVEAVGFKDLNGDGLTDVIMAGKCLAAKDSYPSNAVYANSGSGFTTRDEANAKLENAKSVKDIEAIVKKSLTSFF